MAEVKVLRLSLEVKKMEMVQNEHVRGKPSVSCLRNKVKAARLRWFGHQGGWTV